MPSRPVFVVRAQAVAVAAAGGGASSWSLEDAPAPTRARAPRGGAAQDSPVDAMLQSELGVLEDDLMLPAAIPVDIPSASTPFGAGGLELRETSLAEARADKPLKSAGRAKPHKPKGSAGRRLFQLFALVALGVGGVAGGQYAMMKGLVAPLQVHPALEPLSPLLLGGLVGVLLAWPVIRWTSPRR